MDDFLKNQIINSIKYIPANIVKSFFIPKSSDETKALRKLSMPIRAKRIYDFYCN